MDINTIANYIDLSQVKNLSNLFVVIKKYTNVTYYYGCIDPSRPARCARSSRYKNAKYAILFSNKEEAQKKCDELNAQRKRIKFRVDEAAKHFVSNFSLVFNKYAEKKVKLINTPVSLQDLKKGTKNVNTSITKEMVDEVARNLRELKADYNKQVAELNTRLANNLQVHENKINVVNNVIKFLTDGTIEKLVAQNKTTNDDKYEILYGSSNNGNT